MSDSGKQTRSKWIKPGLVLFAPLLFLLVTEGLLALGGLFPPVRLLLTTSHQGVAYVRTNPDFGQLFLPRRENPMPSPVWTTRAKPDGVLRVVLVGESAAAGFPHPEFNLARLIQVIWADRYPEQPVEVINLTMVGVNSHILRLFVNEALALEPDVILLYAGHNEAIGPFGPAQVFGRAYPVLTLTRLNLWIRNTRVGRAVEAGYRRILAARGQVLPRWLGLEEFRDHPLQPGDSALDRMARHAAANYRSMVDQAARRGVRTLIAIPAVNLTDWPPLGSQPPAVDDETALASWRAGDVRVMNSAWQAYRLARSRSRAGDWAEAWPLYRRASDVDLYRFSVDEPLRRALAAARGSWPSSLTQVVDVDRLLHEESPTFKSDRAFFYEHVHLTFEGKVRVAALLVDGLAGLLGKPASAAAQTVDSEAVARQVLFTPWDDYESWQNIWNLLSLGVFAGQPEREERDAYITAKTLALREELDRNWGIGRLEMMYREARAAVPDDPVLDFIAGRLLLDLNAYQAAENALRTGLDRFPVYPEACLNLARLLLLRTDYTGADQMLAQAEHGAPQHPRLPLLRGTLFARTGRLAEARALLEEVVAAQPRQHNAWVNLGNVCLLQGDELAARRVFQRCLNLEPADPYVLATYSRLLATSSSSSPAQRQQALGYAQQSVRLKPSDYRFRGTLAVAFAATGRAAEAEKEASRVLAEAATAGDTETRSNLLADIARFNMYVAP